MTNIAIELLNECKTRGIVLFLAGDELRYRAPQGALDAELKSALQEHKVEIMKTLKTGFYDHRLGRTITELNRRGVSVMDYPPSTRERALDLEERMTRAANAGDREGFLKHFELWKGCFH